MTDDLPTGTLTFLFSDVEGSTELWEQEPDAMRLALARHDALLRAQVEAYGGKIVKTTGDGLHAVFQRATQAVAMALACQQALQAEDWAGLSHPLRVRMGLHTGEAELRDGDYYSSAVNRSARLMAIASGGQTLLSMVTAELVQADLPAGVTLQDLGEQRLRDLSRPERVFQLAGPGLPDEFPALRSLNRLPNNLPIQLTSFIGREREIAETIRLLATTRLLTLIGPGGTGKTRLALQASAEVLENYPAGVWWVELAPLADPSLIVPRVAAALGVREQQGRPLFDSLIDYLRAKILLLILDNCEHLVEASARLVTDLLSSCARLTILASSREALGVAGETIYRVPSLSLPDPESLTPEGLLQSEATRLFLARARAALPGFELTDHNLPAVAQICRRLDGIPLALELAAGRVRLFSAEQIAARLDDRFRLLTGGSRTAVPRQQTLEALIDWSYDLLDEPERAALQRVSVFAGGWSFDAAEALLGDEALDLLAHLVDKSLVVAAESSRVGELRYHLLETIRQYGRDKLLESGEAPAVRDLHLKTFLQLAIEAEPQLEGPQILSWLDRLTPELDNFSAALEWGLVRSPGAALQLAACLRFFWEIRAGLLEGRSWLEQGLDRFGSSCPEDEAARLEWQAQRAHGLAASGLLAFAIGELNTAREQLTESAELARQSDSPKTLASALGLLGLIATWQGDAATAEAVVLEGLKLNQVKINSSDWIVFKTVQSNLAALIYHDNDQAAEFLKEIVRLQQQELANPWQITMSLLGLGNLAVSQGNDPDALAYFQESEKLFDQLCARAMVCAMQSEQAHIMRRAGKYAQAAALYAISIPRWQELGGLAPLAHELECLAFIAIVQKYSERAACLLGAAEGLREKANAPMRTTERLEYDSFTAALHRQLDAAAFATAWVAGQAMNLEQAVALALEITL